MIGAVILAAGASQRMGQPKALLRIFDETLLDRVIRTAEAAGVDALVVAIGPPHGSMLQAQPWLLPANLRIHWAWNAHPERGMLSSLQTALPLLPPAVEGALIWPVDVPLVTATTVRTILQSRQTANRESSTMRPIVPTFQKNGGHPLWLPEMLFGETLALSTDLSLRTVMARHPPLRLEVDDPEVTYDLDTPWDLERAIVRQTPRLHAEPSATSKKASVKRP